MHKDRALWAALAVLCLAFAAYKLRETGGTGWMPGCAFKKVTGLDCPGCGMTRAATATLQGRIMDAFRLNPVGMVLFPLAMLALSLEVIGWVRGKPLPIRLNPGRLGAIVLVVVLMGWWILRNLI